MSEVTCESEYRQRLEYFWNKMPEPLRKAYHNDSLVNRVFEEAVISGKTYVQALESLAEHQIQYADELRRALSNEIANRNYVIQIPK